MDNVTLLGRVFLSPDGGICMGLSGTGAELDFTGDRLSITLCGNCGQSDKLARVGVFVDGHRVKDICLSDSAQTVQIIGKGDTPVNVKIIKLSECAFACCKIISIDAHGGKMQKAAQKQRKIEFIGDSMTCGYGVDDYDMTHGFSTLTEDCTKSFAVKTAQLLCAQYSLVSYSGYGVISGYTETGVKDTRQVLPKYYEKCGYTESTGFDGQDPSELEWDFSAFTPDVIVINLGTNDLSYTGTSAEREQEFIQGYVDFLKQVRSKNHAAKIICTLGTMGTQLNGAMLEAVRQYSSLTGDKNIDTLELEQQNTDADGVTINFHPSEKTYDKVALKLSEKIRSDMGWED